MASSQREQSELVVRFELMSPMLSRGADQSRAELRLTELKALMRLWWRRWWWGGRSEPRVDELRRAEVKLFGGPASAGGDPSASRVRLRCIEYGLHRKQLDHIFGDPSEIRRPHSVRTRQGRGVRVDLSDPVSAARYLAYGWAKNPSEIGETQPLQGHFTVRIELPQGRERELLNVLWLIDRFGTLGSRAANGWGSLGVAEIHASSGQTQELLVPERNRLVHPWNADGQWPYGLIEDGGRMMSGQRTVEGLKTAMSELAQVRRLVAGRRRSNQGQHGRSVNALRLRVGRSPTGQKKIEQFMARWYFTGPTRTQLSHEVPRNLIEYPNWERWDPWAERGES